DRDLVVDLLALVGVQVRIDADIAHHQLALERDRAQLLGQRGGILHREAEQLRAALEDRADARREILLDRGEIGVQGSELRGFHASEYRKERTRRYAVGRERQQIAPPAARL